MSNASMKSRASLSRETLTSELIEGLIENNSVYYVDNVNGKAVRHVLDFSSPRTREAAEQLGIAYQDCLRPERSEFNGNGIDSKIANLRYQQQSKRVNNLKKAVYEKRKELIQRAKHIELGLKKTNKGEQQSKCMVTTPIFDEAQILIRPNERKAMKNFISKIMLEKELNENIQRHTSSAQSARCTERTLPEKKKSRIIQEKPLHNSFSQTTIDDFLTSQVEKRIEGAQKLADKLREEKRKKEENELQREQERELANSKLKNFKRRQKRAKQIWETANTEKIIIAAQSTTAANKTLEKVEEERKIKEKQKLSTFFVKAEKIGLVKQKRAERIAQLAASVKLRNAQHYQSNKYKKEEQEQTFSSTQRDRIKNLESKMSRNQIKKAATEDYQYSRKVQQLEEEMRQKNMERLKRIQEYNRQRVIEKHSALEEKLREKKKNSAYFQQYIFRKESYERETAQLARELLSRLAKLDPNDQKEQKKLIKTLRAMNSKFSLGLPVSFFRKYLPAPKKEEIQPKP